MNLGHDARVLVNLLRGGALRDASPRGAARLIRRLWQGRRDLYLAAEVHALQRPSAIAVRDERRALTWRELDDAAAALAGWMLARGIGPGAPVALHLSNRVEFFVVAAACARLGAVPMPASPSVPPELAAARLRDTGAVLAFVEPPLLDATRGTPVVLMDGDATGATSFADARARPFTSSHRADGPDLVLFTSGTTGRSKGTRITTRRAGPLTAFRYLDAFDLSPDAVLFTPCPLYHAAPLVLAGLTLTVGGTVVVAPRFDAPVEQLRLAGATHTFLVPTLTERLSRASDEALEHLRRGPLRALLSGGAACRPALKRRILDRLGPVLYDFYGATELGIVSIAGPAELAWDPATIGRILPGVEARLVDDDGRVVPPGEPGLLQVRADSVSDGYLDEPVHGAHRWHTAGDICRIRDGLLYVVDRKRDVVISGGVNLFPVDVEEVLEAHPSVREAAAVGVPDPEWGEALLAFVVLEDGAAFEAEALDRHCRAKLARVAVPKAIRRIDVIPRSATGKVLRRTLRDLS